MAGYQTIRAMMEGICWTCVESLFYVEVCVGKVIQRICQNCLIALYLKQIYSKHSMTMNLFLFFSVPKVAGLATNKKWLIVEQYCQSKISTWMAYELPVIKAVLYDNIHWITNAMERTASKQYFGKSGNGARCVISKALNLSDVCK